MVGVCTLFLGGGISCEDVGGEDVFGGEHNVDGYYTTIPSSCMYSTSDARFSMVTRTYPGLESLK
jgi:hypothetical protein